MIFLDVVHTASGNWTARIFGKTPTGLLIYKYDIFPNTEWGKNQAVKLAMKWFHENPESSYTLTFPKFEQNGKPYEWTAKPSDKITARRTFI